MFRKIILAIAALAIIGVAYTIYIWQEDTTLPTQRPVSTTTAPAFTALPGKLPTTTPAGTAGAGLKFKELSIPEGQAPVIRFFEPNGDARIVFRATRWAPVSDDEFHLVEPRITLTLPGGQLAYIVADEGQVRVQRGGGNNFTPKSGWLKGHIRINVDRTKPQWRKENPDLADPEKHPEQIVRIWLEEARFDLDISRLDSQGPLIVQSAEATIEGTGLTLIWNEVNRHIKLLQIHQGKRATLKGTDISEFSGARQVKVASQNQDNAQGNRTATQHLPEASPATKPAPDAKQARDDEERPMIQLLQEGDTSYKPAKNRVDTYHVVFTDNVHAQQKDGVQVVGWLKAHQLEILKDFGRAEREAMEYTPTSQPSSAPAVADTQPAPGNEKTSVLELTWSGPLELQPVESPETQPAASQPLEKTPTSQPTKPSDRFHVIATGAPVEMFNQQAGRASCTRLEYHDDTKEVWLTGTAQWPVELNASQNQQLQAENVYVDSRAGLATVQGPGKLLEARTDEKDANPLQKCLAQGHTSDDLRERNVEVTWQRAMQIEFDVSAEQKKEKRAAQDASASVKEKKPRKSPKSMSNASPLLAGSVLKRATFDGDVRFSQSGESITADHTEITFREPTEAEKAILANASKMAQEATAPNKTRGTSRPIADHILASGGVNMTRGKEQITCDQLEVEMTVDDAGNNVPRIGHAIGHVAARQDQRVIRADERLDITLVSSRRGLTAEQQQRLEEAARRCNIEKDSEQWRQIQDRLSRRRELTATAMTARGNVEVTDPADELRLVSDSLECQFGSNNQISHALVVGHEENPASLGLKEFYIRGPQLVLDMNTESVEVPGRGMMRFRTGQDLDGRSTKESVPITVTWDRQMWLRGKENAGTFYGSVRAASPTTHLECSQEMRITFADLPTPMVATQPTSPLPRNWIFTPLSRALQKKKETQKNSASQQFSRQVRKKLTYVHALGDAVILSSAHDENDSQGAMTRTLESLLPLGWKWPTSAPASTASPRPLLSRVRVAGPQIAIDLMNENMVVEGKGNLLLEDYRLNQPKAVAATGGTVSTTLLGVSSGSSLNSMGPSQTLFTWAGSMSFLNGRNMAVFDQQVVMNHRAGSEMVLSGELAAAMNLDPKKVAGMKGRRASLTCDNLLVGFDRDRASRQQGPSPLSRATRLKLFDAKGSVRMEEGTRCVVGTNITYDASSGMVRVIGSPTLPPQIIDQDARTGRLNVWRGDSVEWNLKTNTIKAKGSNILGTGG